MALATIDVPHAQAVELCALRKTAEAGTWNPGWKVGAMVLVMGVICNPPRRGLHVEIYLHRSHKLLRRTIDFGLFDRSSGTQERVYQLTIADSDSLTHTERGKPWFGSHKHVGDQQIKLEGMDDVGFHDALRIFCEDTGLTIVDNIDDPTTLSLH